MSLQYLKKEVRDEVDKHQRYLQVELTLWE